MCKDCHQQYQKTLDLTTALRPELLPDEQLLFVQDAVGLYEGKFKIPEYQNGHAYLTSHRICYVDNNEPRKNSTAIELKNVERYELHAGFLKSSPKITLHPKSNKRLSIQSRGQFGNSNTPPTRSATASPLSRGVTPFGGSTPVSNSTKSLNITWVCPICTFSNPLPTNFDAAAASAHTPIPPCLACGIKPPLANLLKAAISSASSRPASEGILQPTSQYLLESHEQYNGESVEDYNRSVEPRDSRAVQKSSFQCPRCTFKNHPSLLSCELCGAPLLSAETPGAILHEGGTLRAESPGPTLEGNQSLVQDTPEYMKISFRAGGDKIFHERLKGAMVQRKWLLQNAPPVPPPQKHLEVLQGNGRTNTLGVGGSIVPEVRPRGVGIAGLERRGLELRQNNEMVIGNAFEDLEALMTSAKEIIALAESFAKQSTDESPEAKTIISESAAALGMVTTKDMLGPSTGSDSLYLSELSRNLAEYLTDERRGVLRREGGIMSLVDLWAMFNRARNGVELISPSDFEKAARLWVKLSLPVRLREFRNGLLVVQRYDWTDDKTIAQLLAWMQELHAKPPIGDTDWGWQTFGRGVTAQEAAAQFGWSVGVATEELEMAEEKGILCREEGIEGVHYWQNWFSYENNFHAAVVS